MALDGSVIANLVSEFNRLLTNGRLQKIYQPENDELILTIKNERTNYKLLLSANASLPLVYLTEESKANPMTAPNFCMLLRKHLNGGKIIRIFQPYMERIIQFEIEHLNEMGDLCRKFLIIEIMGKHSNIIFCKDDYTIIDSIKHISANISSIREVLPGRTYVEPLQQDKISPFELTETYFSEQILTKPLPIHKAIYTSLIGFSPIMAQEVCYRADLDSSSSTSALNDLEKQHLYHTLRRVIDSFKHEEFSPSIVYKGDEPIEFSSIPLTCYSDYQCHSFESISKVLETFYSLKNTITRIKQKSADLRRVVNTLLERNYKKYHLQQKQLEDTEKRDKFKIYGELINTYGYNLESGTKKLDCLNYYTNEEISIPLDDTLSAKENAIKYFDRYNKLKRTYEASLSLIEETKKEIDHLESISTALDIALQENDLIQLREELMEYGYIKKRYTGKNQKKQKITSKPFHYISSDGYDIYVGKNNFQNEDLTFKLATGNDWWFHAKGVAGSHVIVKTNGDELPDRTFEEAGQLAGYYSKNREAPKVEIDYTQKKHIKKPSGSLPGFVIYHTNYSLLIEPKVDHLKEIN